MVRQFQWGIASQQIDELNLFSQRNLRNTPRRSFNCGGFALGCFSWYCPRRRLNTYGSSYSFCSLSEAKRKTGLSVQIMLEDFPTMRVVTTLEEVQSDEYPILFRHSSDGDFHFIKRADNGVWYHKRGASINIEIMPKEKIFDIWVNRYDGPVVIFAKKKY